MSKQEKRTEVEVEKIHMKVDGLELEFTLEQLRAIKECLDKLFGDPHPSYIVSSDYKLLHNDINHTSASDYTYTTTATNTSVGDPMIYWSAPVPVSTTGEKINAKSKPK